MDIQYIYLLQTREFVNSGEPIYKVGKTKQTNYTRFLQYPNGSIQLFQCICNNCDVLEKQVIKLFKNKYQNHKIAGREYFKGELHDMIKDLFHIIENEKTIKPSLETSHSEAMSDTREIVVEKTVHSEIDVREIIVDKTVHSETDVREIIRDETIAIAIDIDTATTQEVKDSCIDNKIDNSNGKYSCQLCNFHTEFNGNIKQHLLTKKHKKKMCSLHDNELKCLKCKNCDKQYKSYSGIWKHAQKCKT